MSCQVMGNTAHDLLVLLYHSHLFHGPESFRIYGTFVSCLIVVNMIAQPQALLIVCTG